MKKAGSAPRAEPQQGHDDEDHHAGRRAPGGDGAATRRSSDMCVHPTRRLWPSVPDRRYHRRPMSNPAPMARRDSAGSSSSAARARTAHAPGDSRRASSNARSVRRTCPSPTRAPEARPRISSPRTCRSGSSCAARSWRPISTSSSRSSASRPPRTVPRGSRAARCQGGVARFPSAASQLRGAEYEVEVSGNESLTTDALRGAVVRLLGANGAGRHASARRERAPQRCGRPRPATARRGRGGPRGRRGGADGTLRTVLRLDASGAGRPEDVVQALDLPLRVRSAVRTRLLFVDTPPIAR